MRLFKRRENMSTDKIKANDLERLFREKLTIVRGGSYDTYAANCSPTNWNMLTAYMKTDTSEYGGSLWLKEISFRVVLPRK